MQVIHEQLLDVLMERLGQGAVLAFVDLGLGSHQGCRAGDNLRDPTYNFLTPCLGSTLELPIYG